MWQYPYVCCAFQGTCQGEVFLCSLPHKLCKEQGELLVLLLYGISSALSETKTCNFSYAFHHVPVLKVLRWRRRLLLFRFKHILEDFGTLGPKSFACVARVHVQQELKCDPEILSLYNIISLSRYSPSIYLTLFFY